MNRSIGTWITPTTVCL